MADDVRCGTDGDVGVITTLINRAYVVERFFKIGDRIDEDGVRALQKQGTFLILERAGRPAGCVYVEPRGERGYLGLLSVDPAMQGTGAGRVLMTAAEDHFVALGVRHADLRVVNLREELPAFYRKLGYELSGTEPFSDPDEATQPCHFILMSKDLGA